MVATSCKRITVTTDPSDKLEFSSDTVSFDTVFTSLGSSTKNFKVFNPHNQSILITRVELAGGGGSAFRINVDGLPGINFSDLEIAPKDSMYIFVEVTVDPNAQALPFVIHDSIKFLTNGNPQSVLLEAYGQNAHFIRDSVICNETWDDDLPYVLLGSVLVDTNCTLTITEGVNIYAHADAFMFVAGTLNISGSKDSIVTFEGDRLENFFDDLPGQWGGIVFLRGSTGNSIRHARFSEATSAIIAGSSTSSDLNDFTESNKPNVEIYQTVIRNCSQWGVFSFLSDIKMENCLVYGCGDNNVALLFGGTHELVHCTIANYGVIGIDHTTPVLRLTNFAVQSQTNFYRNFSATFTNSIFYGNKNIGTEPQDGEIDLDFIDEPGIDTSYLFEHCIIRTNEQTNPPLFVSTLRNQDPLFEDVTESEDYTPGETSPALDAGKSIPGFAEDVFGSVRPNDQELDIGAIERP